MNMNIERKPALLKIAVLGFLVAVGAAWLGSPGNAKADQKAAVAGRAALTVRTTVLREEKWSRSISANGSIIPWQEAVISTPLQGLRIAEVLVSVGDHVKQGDVLVTLDYMARGAEQSDLARAMQGRIVAPDSGVISAVNANVGSSTQPGVELFRLIRKGRLEWRADLTAEELMLMRKGMTAEVAVDEGRTFKGAVRAISPSVNMQTRYGFALVSLPDSSGIIAGAFARGTFDVSGGKRSLRSLPLSALLQRGSETYVLVVDEGGHVHERKVSVGQRNGDRVEIKQGLKANEPVVETGGAFLTEGDVVQVLKP
jgi:multidrug efflux pump subunit AcrA (membrane-fusion protein)